MSAYSINAVIMVKMGKLIEKNRKFFGEQKSTASDQKSIDLSGDNARLSEIIDLMMWSVQNRIKEDAKKRNRYKKST